MACNHEIQGCKKNWNLLKTFLSYLFEQWLYKIVRLLDVHCELSLLHWAETDFWKNTFHGLLLFLNSFVYIYLRIYISDK